MSESLEEGCNNKTENIIYSIKFLLKEYYYYIKKNDFKTLNNKNYWMFYNNIYYLLKECNEIEAEFIKVKLITYINKKIKKIFKNIENKEFLLSLVDAYKENDLDRYKYDIRNNVKLLLYLYLVLGIFIILTNEEYKTNKEKIIDFYSLKLINPKKCILNADTFKESFKKINDIIYGLVEIINEYIEKQNI